MDPVFFIKYEFDDAWNEHDEDGVLLCFAEGATIFLVPPPPGLAAPLHGSEAVRGWVRRWLPGFQMESSAFRVEGEWTRWFATLACTSFRRHGVEVAGAACEALIQQDKIVTLRVTFTPQTVAKFHGGAPSDA